MKCPGLHKKSCLQHYPHDVGMEGLGSHTKRFFVRNCMKCKDLDRKNHVSNSYPSWRVQVGFRESTDKYILLGIEWSIQIWTRKLSFPTLHLHGGAHWGGHVEIFSARYCMKCPALQKSHVYLTPPLWGGAEVRGQFTIKCIHASGTLYPKLTLQLSMNLHRCSGVSVFSCFFLLSLATILLLTLL